MRINEKYHRKRDILFDNRNKEIVENKNRSVLISDLEEKKILVKRIDEKQNKKISK